MTLAVTSIVNAAGHGARQASLNIEGMNADAIPPHYMAKGQYFTTTKRPPFRHLIYPMPSGGGLGIHLTLDTGGGARFGPDINWVDAPSYDVDPASAPAFMRASRNTGLILRSMILCPHGPDCAPRSFQTAADLLISLSSPRAITGRERHRPAWHELPGLTSSLAIADHLVDEVGLDHQAADFSTSAVLIWRGPVSRRFL